MSDMTYHGETEEADKPLVWLGGEVHSPPLSAAARVEVGVLLRRLQRGEALELPHSRPMPEIGDRCHELRVVDDHVSWRVVYCIDRDAILILDVFAKKSRTTPRRVIDVCRKRLRHYQQIARSERMIEEKQLRRRHHESQ